MRTRGGGRSGLRRVAAVVLAAVTAVLAILVLFAPSVFSTPLGGVGLWPHGDRYTALYFTKRSGGSRPAGSRSPLLVGFAVESHEAGRRTYSFRVSVGRSAESQRVVKAGALTLSPGDSRVETFELGRAPKQRELVEVRLSGGDTISYWTS